MWMVHTSKMDLWVVTSTPDLVSVSLLCSGCFSVSRSSLCSSCVEFVEAVLVCCGLLRSFPCSGVLASPFIGTEAEDKSFHRCRSSFTGSCFDDVPLLVSALCTDSMNAATGFVCDSLASATVSFLRSRMRHLSAGPLRVHLDFTPWGELS
jgi:hypothetical protein